MFWLLGLLITGALIGWIASMIMGTDQEMGMVQNIGAGLVGSFIGKVIYSIITVGSWYATGIGVRSLIFGVLGSCIFIGILKAMNQNKRLR